ncbi:MAG TPA: 2'-deoxycytidine 5'-triphosphate deaminase [Roseiarcus sp.]|nr:2'-deoxycytidine 5'-triphosphate deaminase [Roseiarcus sp.]
MHARSSEPELFDAVAPPPGDAYFLAPYGLFARQKIKAMVGRKMIVSSQTIDESQFQPASLDLRLGREAYRVRASFLPGRNRSVLDHLESLKPERISLTGDGAVLEKGIVYIAALQERLDLLPSLSAAANPKSSTGRLDIFTRLIVDGGELFDEAPLGYSGPLYAEISPRSFSVRVREGSKLNQIRFRSRNSQQKSLSDFALTDKDLRSRHAAAPLVDRDLDLRDGLILRVGLEGSPGQVVGYRAIKNSEVIDVDRPGAYPAAEFWEPIQARRDKRLILDPDEFYILASRERVQIPPDLAAEMAPIDPAIGEFRVHYAGFFDPGFGHAADGRPSARAVLEVRSRDVPFLLEDGQPVGRLVFEKLAERTDALYGATAVSNYQGQGLKLSKHFRPFGEG